MSEHDKTYYSLEELKRARDCYEGYQDKEEVYYFVGALRYACDEIERLNKENKELNKICARKSHYIDKKDLEIGRLKEMKLHTEKYASEMEDKYILEKSKNDKAIEYIENYLCSDEYIQSDINSIANAFVKLVDILKGFNKE